MDSSSNDPGARNSLLYLLRIRYLIGDLTDGALPDAAMQALDLGIAAPSLWKVVTLDSGSREEVLLLLDSATAEAGLPDDMEPAVRYFVMDMGGKISRGEVMPYDGARSIWKAALLVPEVHDFDPFIYAASEYEDRVQDRIFFETEILKEARRVTEAMSQT